MTDSEIYQYVVNTFDDMLKTVDDFGGGRLHFADNFEMMTIIISLIGRSNVL
jgi:hypothetical protein